MEKTFPSLFIICGILLTACGAGTSVQPIAILSPTIVPTLTLTPEPTFTPTVTPTPRIPVSVGTEAPTSGIVISEDNINQVVELARWGEGLITDAVYSPDGKSIAVSSTTGVTIYSIDGLDENGGVETDTSVTSIAFSPNGESLAIGLEDNSIEIWSVKDWSFQTKLMHSKDGLASDGEQITDIAYSPEGDLLVSGSSDRTVALWQVSSGKLVFLAENHLREVTEVFFSPDGQSLYSSAEDGKIYSQSVSDGKLIKTLSAHKILHAAISSNGTVLVAYDHEASKFTGNFVVWDVQNGEELISLEGGNDANEITGFAISPDGKFLIGVFEDRSGKIWNVDNGAVLNVLEDLQNKSGWYYLANFTTSFSPDGKSYFIAGSSVIGIWDAKKNSLLEFVKIKSDSMYDMSISPDGDTLAVIEGTDVNLLDISNGMSIPSEEKIQSNATINFLSDGATLVASTFDCTVQFWPISDQGIRRTFEADDCDLYNGIRGVAVSPDNKILAIGLDSYPSAKVELRQISDGKLVQTLLPGISFAHVIDVVFSPDSQLLVAAYGDQIKVYQMPNGVLVNSFSGVFRPAFAPNGAILAAGGVEDRTLRVWEPSTGESLFVLRDRPDRLLSIAFSSDGSLLASGYRDGSIQIHLTSDGTLLNSWKGASEAISDLIITPDGKFIISSSYDGTIRLWGIKP